MTIGQTEIARIDALITALGEDVQAEGLDHALRRLVPDVQLRHCDASDVLEEPFRRVGTVDLHLLDTRNHCIAVTSQAEEATALLIAQRASP